MKKDMTFREIREILEDGVLLLIKSKPSNSSPFTQLMPVLWKVDSASNRIQELGGAGTLRDVPQERPTDIWDYQNWETPTPYSSVTQYLLEYGDDL